MRNSTATSRAAHLIVDLDGEVLEAPDETRASQAWIDSHPYVNVTGSVLTAGLPATDEAVEYEVTGRAFGSLYLRRI